MEPATSRSAASRWGMLLATSAVVVPAAAALWMMAGHWVPVPYWDEWKTPGEQIASYYRGTLTFAELCSQHNESRKLFPRLIYLPLSIAFKWDVRWLMALSFGLVCGGSILLYKLARRSCASPLATVWCFAVMNAWLFWPRQYENFLLGIQGELFVPAFALAAACLINLSPRPLWQKALMNASLAHISTYTVANGMLVWLVAFPIEASGLKFLMPLRIGRTGMGWRLGYCAAAMVSIGCYFHGYQHPLLSPPMVLTLRRMPELALFVARWLGNVAQTGNALVAGTVVGVLFVAFATIAIKLSRASGRWQLHYPWLLLGLYTLISGCITAVGRLGFGAVAATHFRYAPFTVFLYIATAGLAASIHRELRPESAGARRWRASCAIGSLIVAILGLSAFRQERHLVASTMAEREASLLTLRWSEAIPRNPNLALRKRARDDPHAGRSRCTPPWVGLERTEAGRVRDAFDG